jgi:hypothetical protein
MFTPALNVARRHKSGDGHILIPAQCMLQRSVRSTNAHSRSSDLPDGYSFSQLYDELASNKSLSKQVSSILHLSIFILLDLIGFQGISGKYSRPFKLPRKSGQDHPGSWRRGCRKEYRNVGLRNYPSQ